MMPGLENSLSNDLTGLKKNKTNKKKSFSLSTNGDFCFSFWYKESRLLINGHIHHN